MNKEKIAKIIYEELSYMYCDNCRYAFEISEDDPDWSCDECHRKNNGWGISMAEAKQIAEIIGATENVNTIIDAFTKRPKGEWKTDMVYAGIEFYRCDQCEYRQSEKTRYCPNCGADMRGDK